MGKGKHEYTSFGHSEAFKLTEEIELHEADDWELVTITEVAVASGVGTSELRTFPIAWMRRPK